MSVSNLPMNNVAGFTGKIGDFIKIERNGEHVVSVTANPGQPRTKTIDNVTDVVDYTKALMGLPFDYRFLKVGQHLFLDVKANIGFSRNAGLIKVGGVWQHANADDSKVMASGLPIVDTRSRNRLTNARVIDTILGNTVEIDLRFLETILGEREMKSAQGILDALARILEAADIEEAAKVRQGMIDDAQEARQQWQASRNNLRNGIVTRPTSLIANVDGIEVDLLQLPASEGVKLYVLYDDGQPSRMTVRWNGSIEAISFIQSQIDRRASFGTEAALKAAGKI